MSLKIRLARAGAKKRPYYRIVVADSKSPRDGRYIEKLGTYNPLLPRDSNERVKLVEERVKHWISVGAQPTDRVLRFLDKAGMAKRDARSNPSKGQPGKKRVEREEAKKAAAAEKAKANPHTKEGITHLNAAIAEGKKKDAAAATGHAKEALTHLEAATK